MMKAIAVDDEPLALDLTESFCKRFSFVVLEKKFVNTTVAKKYLEENQVDLLFLDINMPAISGLEFYKSLARKPMLIFTTSYSEFALKSYELDAVDYLLKPFTIARFEKALLKAHQLYNLVNQQVVKDQRFVLFKIDYGVVRVYLSDITFIEGLDNYLKIHLEKQTTLVVRMTMKACLELLCCDEFIRVHRSYIVSISKIDGLQHKLITIGDEEIPVGKNYEEQVKQAIGS